MSIAAGDPEITLVVEPELLEPPFRSASYAVRTPRIGKDCGPVHWWVQVFPDGNMISRRVWRNGVRQWDDEGVLWPTWPEKSQDEVRAAGAPLEDTQKYWSKAGNRLRDSAKWTATVLGAGLAALVGTSPLRGMNAHRMSAGSLVLGAAGLVLVGVTLLLVLLVMCPRSVSLHDVENAKPRQFLPDWTFLRAPLYRWKVTVQSEQDLYLPCGIARVADLRRASVGGVILGVTATACIVAAFAWPLH